MRRIGLNNRSNCQHFTVQQSAKSINITIFSKNSLDTATYSLLTVDREYPPKNFLAVWKPVYPMCNTKNINLKIKIAAR